MAHFVYAIPCKPGTRGLTQYVGTRQNNGVMYESRVTTTPHLTEARVFNTAGAASNAGRRVDERGKAVPVTIVIDTLSALR